MDASGAFHHFGKAECAPARALAVAQPAVARPADAPPAIVIIEGPIASGKTELVRALVAELQGLGHFAWPIFEPSAQWDEDGLLEWFYRDPARFGYTFQTAVYISRIQEIQRRVSAAEAARAAAGATGRIVYVLERSPVTDSIFMELQRGSLDPIEMKLYHSWCDTFAPLLPLDLSGAAIVYLRTSMDECMARLKGRERRGEIVQAPPSQAAQPSDAPAAGGVSRAYQEQLHAAHLALLYGERAPADAPAELAQVCATLAGRKRPFRVDSILSIEPALADRNFRDPGAEQKEVITEIISRLRPWL